MDKTIKINIAGTLFQIDEEAYRILRDYLQAINNRFRYVQGGHETVEDIEFRIAEIFQSQKGLAGVIIKENVDAMISIIGKPEDFGQNETGAEQPGYHSQRKRLYRNPDDSVIGGVCGGLGAYLDTDPVLLRVLFAIFAIFFGVGFLLYIILWIALPKAITEAQKRELTGNLYQSHSHPDDQTERAFYSGTSTYKARYNDSSRIGNAFNEIFRAIGSIFFVILRIFMIIVGVVFTLTGSITIFSMLILFVFKFPWAVSFDGFDANMINLPDFLSYIVNPSTAPWIIVLSLLAVAIPMIALIYWGVKMIFWFKAKDGIISLAGFILWIMIISVLSIILFNEGISFSESARTSSETIMPNPPDTLYVTTDHKIADLKADKKFTIPDNNTVFIVDTENRIYITPRMQLNVSDGKNAKVEIRKRSSGPTSAEAERKSETLIYNYRISRDTLYLDEFFTIPAGSKWSADFITINLSLPEKTVLYFDSSAEKLFHRRIHISRTDNEVTRTWSESSTEPWELGNKFWTITEEGLEKAEKAKFK